METPEFPSNSDASKRFSEASRGTYEDKELKQVTSGTARKKSSIRKKFLNTFVAGDFKSAVQYALFEIVLVGARDTVLDGIQGGLDKWFNGDARRSRGYPRPQTGPFGHVDYTQRMPQSRWSSPQRALSRETRARARHDFDDIVIETRGEAEQVIEELFEVVNRYDAASVADLYQLVGLASNHQDTKWGWTDIRGAGVTKVRDGYLLDLPSPEPIRP